MNCITFLLTHYLQKAFNYDVLSSVLSSFTYIASFHLHDNSEVSAIIICILQ